MDIEKLIHVNSPYEGFVSEASDLQGWGGHKEFFGMMIDMIRPQLIIEVGTWKGKSAIAMADLLESIELKDKLFLEALEKKTVDDTKIVCVDTWLGATEMWDKKDDAKRYLSLKLKNGYPQLYYTFLSNVMNALRENRIIPFPQTSANAARHFAKNNVKAGMIYIDASHEYDDVKQDLNSYFPLLEKGGVMIGDDYCKYWHGVIEAVDEFAEQKNLRLYTRQYPNAPGEAPSDYCVLCRGVVPL